MSEKDDYLNCFNELMEAVLKWSERGVLKLPGRYLLLLAIREALDPHLQASLAFYSEPLDKEIMRTMLRTRQKLEAYFAFSGSASKKSETPLIDDGETGLNTL